MTHAFALAPDTRSTEIVATQTTGPLSGTLGVTLFHTSAHRQSSGTQTETVLESANSGPAEVNIVASVKDWVINITNEFRPLEEQLEQIQLETELWARESEAPNERSFEMARVLLSRLKCSGFRPERIVHSAEGGIGVYFRHGNRYADFECANTGTITALTSNGVGDISAFSVDDSFEGYRSAIEKIRAFLNA